jgi:hypothetical protein
MSIGYPIPETLKYGLVVTDAVRKDEAAIKSIVSQINALGGVVNSIAPNQSSRFLHQPPALVTDVIGFIEGPL